MVRLCPTCHQHLPESADEALARWAMIEQELSAPTHHRILDALLPEESGGKDNYAVDRAMTEQLDARAPRFRAGVRAGHAFLLRAARELAEHGVTQFVVIGCGYPRGTNVHTVTGAVAAHARTLYLDSGQFVGAHGRALLVADSMFLDVDPNDPDAILAGIDHIGLDIAQPIALVFGSLVLERLDAPGRVIEELVAALPDGYLVATHIRADVEAATAKAAATVYAQHGLAMRPRTGGEIAGLLAGLDLLAPGLVVAGHWLPDLDAAVAEDEPGCCWAAVATWGGIR
ncbi:SAM-dependent methyltransferase [Nocardia takedensis]